MAKTNSKNSRPRLGSILVAYGLPQEKLERALEYKRLNDDILLGEACVHLGFVSRTVLDAAIKQQSKRRGATNDMLRVATERTKRMATAIAQLAATSSDVADKIE